MNPFSWGKEDKRPQKRWWAPGGYIRTCCICEERFVGDKRAGHCADCAYDDTKHPEIPPEELAKRIDLANQLLGKCE